MSNQIYNALRELLPILVPHKDIRLRLKPISSIH